MPEPKAYALSPDFADRVEDVVAQVEAEYKNPMPGIGRRRVHYGTNVQRLRVMSSEPEGFQADVPYWPARILRWDAPNGLWIETTDFDAVLVFGRDTTETGSGDESGGDESGSGDVVIGFSVGEEVWAKEEATVTLDDESGTGESGSGDAAEEWPAFAEISGGGTGSFTDDSFLAFLTGKGAYTGDLLDGSGCENGPSPDCPPAYSFHEVFISECGVAATLFGGRSGDGCVNQLYEENGLDVSLMTNGHPTVVRVRRIVPHGGIPSVPKYSFSWPLDQCNAEETESGETSLGRANEVTIRFPSLNDAGECCLTAVRMVFPKTVEVCVTESQECAESGSGG